MKPSDGNKLFIPEKIESHVDSLRSMVAQHEGAAYRSHATLAEAIANDAHVILQGDYGGQIYFTCPATKVKCSESGLKRLLDYLDARSWNDTQGASIFFEDRTPDSTAEIEILTGAAADLKVADIWLHTRLQELKLEARVRSFVFGVTDEL